MEIRDWFILISTFLVGVMSGMYFYTTSYAPRYDERDLFSELDEMILVEFDMIALQYGSGFSNDIEPPVFEIDSQGNYRYTPAGVEQIEQDGRLPDVLLRELQGAIAEANLKEYSEDDPRSDCDSVDYEYNIIREGTEYTLDTCNTNFSHSTGLGNVLQKIWQYMDLPEEHRVSISNATDEAVDSGGVDIKEEAAEKKRIILNPVKYLEQGMEDAFGDGE